MIETTITILSQYPFQAVLMAMVLSRVVRDGLGNLAGGRSHLTIGPVTAPRSA